MVKISKLIADLQDIHERFGDTCVYIRRGGMSWGAVALNRRDDDQKNGIAEPPRKRTPEQIIGHDALMQLIFEGYKVEPLAPIPEHD